MSHPSIISSAVIGTTAMTLFSYCLSEQQGKNFKEPDLLAKLIYRIWPFTGKYGARIAGWVLHYLVGVFFASLYKACLKKNKSKSSLPVFLVIGATTGIIAVIGWRVTL